MIRDDLVFYAVYHDINNKDFFVRVFPHNHGFFERIVIKGDFNRFTSERFDNAFINVSISGGLRPNHRTAILKADNWFFHLGFFVDSIL
ncbi:Uncharacterised protein [Haemophilus parahaemolyticus]|uniref:Uncharacterized protein n=1 Tax=Haemophilus parahaemolyticus TaxID=735 RepID=A0A377I234_HAEPH|nr:Uncharacterised protein [Haemophilus parahaemolyticus]